MFEAEPQYVALAGQELLVAQAGLNLHLSYCCSLSSDGITGRGVLPCPALFPKIYKYAQPHGVWSGSPSISGSTGTYPCSLADILTPHHTCYPSHWLFVRKFPRMHRAPSWSSLCVGLPSPGNETPRCLSFASQAHLPFSTSLSLLSLRECH